ncbi:hypothetical protein POM88_050441 [Heracleum sosnowskyi]|uniref:F-box domain-containing protein n=1 Tax=Heracleum sosnowskyi TaxID=360622 RepID=A0AAD8GXJ3_9APIA|nr:hypothetical protein POM88_050441 [Heracleum sosnowskyi]
MHMVLRPALELGGLEKAFCNDIMVRVAEIVAGRSLGYFLRNAPLTAKKGRKRKKTNRRSGNGVWGAWDNLPNELLVSVLQRLSIIDYISFSGVCKSWRSAFIDFRKTLMKHQQPLVVVRPKYSKKSCVLYNMFDERSYRTMLPDLPCKYLLGFSCGNLITFDRNRRFWLVNLMTKHELHFPILPQYVVDICYSYLCALLFRSTRLSKTFMVLFSTKRNFLLLSESGASSWQKYILSNTSARISDVKIFYGKIFVLTCDALFGEFDPKADPVFKFFNISSPLQFRSNMSVKMVASADNLYAIVYQFTVDRYLSLFEIDHKKMDGVKQVHDLGAKSLFLSKFSSSVVDTTNWGAGNCVCVNHSEIVNRCSFFNLNGNLLGSLPVVWDNDHSKPYCWYFPSDGWDISCVGENSAYDHFYFRHQHFLLSL